MSNGNEPAYPSQELKDNFTNEVLTKFDGLTKRELASLMVLQGMIQNNRQEGKYIKDIVEMSFRFTDEWLKQSEVGK